MFHPFLRILKGALTGCALFLAVTANATEVWVIADRQHPVRGHPDRLIELDAPARLEAELSAGLPGNSDAANTMLRRRLQAGGTALQQRMAAAYQGIVDAWHLGITRIPAIVVDRRYVVYGEPDMALAVSRIERYREERP
jgi:integrating conjugative element protein (TIGR03757 family)